jgi:hypothetical protein
VISQDELASLLEGTPATSFVGAIEGTELYIGVIRRGESVEAYVCDGAQTAAWFTGTAAGSQLSAANERITLTASESAAGLAGSVTIDGTDFGFNAVPSAYPADVWQAFGLADNGEFLRGGWIVLPDGTQRGAVKSGSTIVSTAALDVSTAAPALGGTLTTPAIPVVPFSSTVQGGATTGPPVTSSACTDLEATYDALTSVANDTSLSADARKGAKNAAKSIWGNAFLNMCFWTGGHR